MRKTMRFTSQDEYESWVNERQDNAVAGATYAGEPVTLEAIAHEFARQPKDYDERWTRSFRDSTDSVIKFHYTWDDSDGFEHRDWVSILLSDACREAGVEFDYITGEDDLEERVYVELVVQGYELDDDGDPVDEDGERARDDIREQIWQAAIDEYNRARDELCSHEDIGEPWFRELVEEMYARVKASVMENMIKAVVEAIRRYGEDDNYDPFYGIRGDDRELAPGERFGNSHQLYQDPVDGAEYIGAGLYDAGELDGTCVWSIGLYSAFYEPDKENIRWAIEQAKLFGEHVYLVRSKCPSKSGEEPGELIVENAYVALKLS